MCAWRVLLGPSPLGRPPRIAVVYSPQTRIPCDTHLVLVQTRGSSHAGARRLDCSAPLRCGGQPPDSARGAEEVNAGLGRQKPESATGTLKAETEAAMNPGWERKTRGSQSRRRDQRRCLSIKTSDEPRPATSPLTMQTTVRQSAGRSLSSSGSCTRKVGPGDCERRRRVRATDAAQWSALGGSGREPSRRFAFALRRGGHR